VRRRTDGRSARGHPAGLLIKPKGLPVMVFLDTEFTDLVAHPSLLALGLVGDGEDTPSFYAEVTDAGHLRAASWYALSAVLPQFGKVAQAACSYRELGQRLGTHLARLTAKLPADELLDVAFGFPMDWQLLVKAVMDAECPSWQLTRRHLRPLDVHELSGSAAGRRASRSYFHAQNDALLQRHHALCDARGLRLAYRAALFDRAWLPTGADHAPA
jgi:hypothetical protein